MAELYLSPLANDDLLSIKRYIETELNSPQAAKHTVQKILKQLKRLTDFPLSDALLQAL